MSDKTHSGRPAKIIQYTTYLSRRSNINSPDRSQIISGPNIAFASCIGYAEKKVHDVFESAE